jgi:hypothetical protein
MKTMGMKRVCTCLGAMILLVATVGLVSADENFYSDKTIRLVVGSAAGRSIDPRLVQEAVSILAICVSGRCEAPRAF